MNEGYVAEIIKNGMRLDNRKLDEYRKPIIIETGISKNADGSAKAKIGDTEVIVGIKLGVDKPYPDTPDEGSIIVSAELLPLSSPDFESGPPDEWAIELARVIDRGIRESKAIDLKKLCIREGELCWIVFIDAYTINNSGNLIDATALAAIAALKDTRMPKLEDDKILFGEMTKEKLPMLKTPVTCTIAKINGKLVVDPDLDEENVIDSRLSVSIFNNRVHAMQKGGAKGISIEEVDEMIGIAIAKCKELEAYIK